MSKRPFKEGDCVVLQVDPHDRWGIPMEMSGREGRLEHVNPDGKSCIIRIGNSTYAYKESGFHTPANPW